MALRGRGATVVELAIVLVILGLLLAFALPYLTSRPMNLRADTNDLVANLRLARDLAISRTTHYRLRAEAFEAKAEKHEEEARKLAARPRNPLEVKWPAMARKSWQRESQLAVQARRAAKECYDLADRHIRLAVEAELAE
jgi:competence protein ComGC